MFRLRKLPLPNVTQKPNNDKNLLGDHDSIFSIDSCQEYKWEPTTHTHTHRVHSWAKAKSLHTNTVFRVLWYMKKQ